MTAPVFVAPLEGRGPVVLTGPEGHHAARVRRLRVGEPMIVVDGAGGWARCEVAAVVRDEVTCTVLDRGAEPAPSPRLVVAQALPKAERGELAVELMSEVGVDEVLPWRAARCVTRWQGERGARALGRWRSTAREAGKQARRARFAEVPDAVTTGQLVERVRSAACAVVLHEEAAQPLAAVEPPATGEVVLVIGPEGGLAPDEVAALTAAGAVACVLGPSVLRTSTAGAVAAGVLLARSSRWGAR